MALSVFFLFVLVVSAFCVDDDDVDVGVFNETLKGAIDDLSRLEGVSGPKRQNLVDSKFVY